MQELQIVYSVRLWSEKERAKLVYDTPNRGNGRLENPHKLSPLQDTVRLGEGVLALFKFFEGLFGCGVRILYFGFGFLYE